MSQARNQQDEEFDDDHEGQAPMTRRRWSFWRVVRRLMLLAVFLVLLVQVFFFLQVAFFRWFDPPSSAFMRSEAMRLAYEEPAVPIRHTWVPYDDISLHAKLAVIASEDTGFMQHYGVDWDAIERALRVNLETGGIAQGGSTITMQLAKNLFLSSDRSYMRKAQEVSIAIMLELMMDKQRILEIYLNLVEFGEGVFGIEAAAQHYFKSSAKQLTSRQAAWLASILPAPKRYDANRGSKWIERKTAVVMRRMRQVESP